MQPNATEKEGIELLYRGRDISDRVLFPKAVVEQYNTACKFLGLPKLSTELQYNKAFNIPQKYLDLDVEEYIVNKIPDIKNKQIVERVTEELEMFRVRNLYPVLQLMIYIVETLKENNVVWGVGRGSSVASYCLYLIGVHKIDSLKYDLDIKEFLK